MEYGIKIGHDPEAVDAMRSAIKDIVHAPTGDVVKVAALKALTRTFAIKGMTISGASIVGDTTHHHTHYAEPEPVDEFDEDEGEP